VVFEYGVCQYMRYTQLCLSLQLRFQSKNRA
jgi:hypothetical protein